MTFTFPRFPVHSCLAEGCLSSGVALRVQPHGSHQSKDISERTPQQQLHLSIDLVGGTNP